MRRWGIISAGLFCSCVKTVSNSTISPWGFRLNASSPQSPQGGGSPPPPQDSTGGPKMRKHISAKEFSRAAKAGKEYDEWAENHDLLPADEFLNGAKQAYHVLGHVFLELQNAPGKLDQLLVELNLDDSIGSLLKGKITAGAHEENLFKLAHRRDHILRARILSFQVENEPASESSDLDDTENNHSSAKVVVQYVVVTPPRRYYLNYDFFYERIKGTESDTERAAFAKIICMSGSYFVLSILDTVLYQFSGKKMDFLATETMYSLLGLPEDFVSHPPSCKKELTFKWVNGKRWIIDDAKIFGLEDVLSATEYSHW